jgi:hypothetical protein
MPSLWMIILETTVVPERWHPVTRIEFVKSSSRFSKAQPFGLTFRMNVFQERTGMFLVRTGPFISSRVPIDHVACTAHMKKQWTNATP